MYRQKKGRGTRVIGTIQTYNPQHGPVILEKNKTAKNRAENNLLNINT